MTAICWIHNTLLWSALLGTTSLDFADSPIKTAFYPLLLSDVPVLLVAKGTGFNHRRTTVLAVRAGARFDPRHGGCAARASLLATCRLVSDRQSPGGTIFAHPEVGGDDALIFIHHRPEDLMRVLQRLRRVLDGSPALEECQWAVEQLRHHRRDHANPCSCVSACCCGPRHQIRQRLVEALDPLPWGSRRSGCARRLMKLTGLEADQWRRKHLRTGRVALAIDTGVDLDRFALRVDVAKRVQEALVDLPPASPDGLLAGGQASRFLEPVETIISPPVIESGKPQRIIAGWITDQLTPPYAITLLEPRVAIWEEVVRSDEPLRRSFLRLQARRRAARIDRGLVRSTFLQPDHAQLALRLLRRNDPGVPVALPRRARRAPIVTVLRHEKWP
ncbi:MAG: hypothetical protein AAEJ47_03490 [Planctomycetota bacterium]